MEVSFERARISDTDLLIEARNKSFYEDYIKYGECPGYNISREDMKKSILNNFSYKIICDNKVIGNVSARKNNDNTYFLGCLCVIPEYENKGIGTKALKFIEEKFKDAVGWNLETPADKLRNHYFYKKNGYKITKEYNDGSVRIVLFEKTINK